MLFHKNNHILSYNKIYHSYSNYYIQHNIVYKENSQIILKNHLSLLKNQIHWGHFGLHYDVMQMHRKQENLMNYQMMGLIINYQKQY